VIPSLRSIMFQQLAHYRSLLSDHHHHFIN